MPVKLFYQNTRVRVETPRKTVSWIKKVAALETAELGEISYIFCGDDYLLELNKAFLRHNTLTDIITFQHNARSEPAAGEIYISIDRVRENARTFKVPFQTELRRVMIHGVLHLMGYDDKTRSQKRQMREKEDASLSLWK